VYQYTPDKIDKRRAHHQAVKQGADDVDKKRIGNLGEFAFEQFCREFLPAELWEWENETAMRKCNPESFAGHDFEVFGYEIDIKTSRDVSAFLPERLVKLDSDDDIIVMVWHRDNEDSLILLGWERVNTLSSKIRTENEFSGEAPDKLDHLATRGMNELAGLGPNTANMSQKPEHEFEPGDKVRPDKKANSSGGIVVEVLPPDSMDSYKGEPVNVAFKNSLEQGPGDWKDIDAALLASYCDDQNIRCYTYSHYNLEFAE